MISGTSKGYLMCIRCIMDTTDPLISFDEEGVCNHCREYDKRAMKELFLHDTGQRKLAELVETIKKEGRNKEYDCIIGVSGGLDSSMTAYTVKQVGLRPLAVHMDNGWDSELAVKNIELLVKKLDIDLHTYVVDWEEFRDLHLALLRASVPNSEVVTDHAIVAILYRTAARENIRYIIGGGNIVTEAIMPDSWGYEPIDWKHIRGIHDRFGEVTLESFPYVTIPQLLYYTFVRRIRFLPILNYITYNKKKAMELLEKEIGWKYYGGKHFESIYTRFFQAYILPRKFKFDKRKAHLSTLICSRQIQREEALAELKKDIYASDKLDEDKQYVIKKLGITEMEFEEIMSLPARTHRDYPSNDFLFNKMKGIVRIARKIATRR